MSNVWEIAIGGMPDMKCPNCGSWNRAYMPNCVKCGALLPENAQEKASWENAMHQKKPSLRITKYEEGEEENVPPQPAPYDPEAYTPEDLADEIELLEQRRDAGERRMETLRHRLSEARRSVREAEVIRPQEEEAPVAENARSTFSYGSGYQRNADTSGARNATLSSSQRRSGSNASLRFDDRRTDIPAFVDGYDPEDGMNPEDADALIGRPGSRGSERNSTPGEGTGRRKKNKPLRVILSLLLFFASAGLFAFGGIAGARWFAQRQDQQVRSDNESSVECFATVTEDGFPAHTIIIRGRENATVFLQETASTYVIADGNVTLTIPDYMWYDTDSSTYAQTYETDTAEITITPFIRYAANGEQYALEPQRFSIEVPISPVYLLNPGTFRAEVGVSIYEVRLNVLSGSTVYIDGTNVSTLIRETGNVSKNVQVLPVGDNTISISVKSKYYRENKMEVVLYRAPQEIPLELVPTVITEWNYEDDDPLHQTTISGTTLPGATITVESPHENLVVNSETGEFTFKPLFPVLGNNDVVIRASFEGRADSVITHTVYFMPTADVYTRRAWDLDSQYSDLINYMDLRKRNGTIYVGTGVIKRIISTSPQMAIMDIGTETFEKLVLLENSSKTTWQIGVRYRIYGEAFGLYDNMPRLTVRYTYLME